MCAWVHVCLYSPVNDTFSQVPFHSFLFNIFVPIGRAVMLEQPRKTGVKVISHMLASHGGEIFIHILPTSRSILEDPPSISEGCGGRVTDYRITVRGTHHAAGWWHGGLLPLMTIGQHSGRYCHVVPPCMLLGDGMVVFFRWWPSVNILTVTVMWYHHCLLYTSDAADER